jgi:hypothetical protein
MLIDDGARAADQKKVVFVQLGAKARQPPRYPTADSKRDVEAMGKEHNLDMNDSQDRGIAGNTTPVKLHASNPTPSPTSVSALQISPDNVLKRNGPIGGRHKTLTSTCSVALIEYMFNRFEELETSDSEYLEASADVSIKGSADGIAARVKEIAHKSHSEPVHSATTSMTTETKLTDASVDVNADASAVAGAHASTVAGRALTLGSAARVREMARKSQAKSVYYAAVPSTTDITEDLYAGDKVHRKLISYTTRTRQPRKSDHPLSWKGRVRSATTTQLVVWSHYQSQVNKESLWPPGMGGSKTTPQHSEGDLAHNWTRRAVVPIRDHDRPP